MYKFGISRCVSCNKLLLRDVALCDSCRTVVMLAAQLGVHREKKEQEQIAETAQTRCVRLTD